MNTKTVQQIIRQTKENYNIIAREWNVSRHQPSGIKAKLVARVHKGQKVLDVGAGNGLIAPLVLKRGGRYVGIDISGKLIALAKKHFAHEIKTKQAAFRVGDSTKKLPYKNNSFDVIFCFAVLHHIPSQDARLRMLKEWMRVLKPGGVAYTIVWNLKNEWTDTRFRIADQLAEVAPGMDPGDVFVPWKATEGKIINRYVHVFEKSELKKLCVDAGFAVSSVAYYNRAGNKTANGEELVIVCKKYRNTEIK